MRSTVARWHRARKLPLVNQIAGRPTEIRRLYGERVIFVEFRLEFRATFPSVLVVFQPDQYYLPPLSAPLRIQASILKMPLRPLRPLRWASSTISRRFATAAERPHLPQTVIEKVVQKYAVGLPDGKVVKAGDYVMIRPEHVMTHDNTGPVISK